MNYNFFDDIYKKYIRKEINMENCLKLIIPILDLEQNSGDLKKDFELIAEEPESADKTKIAFTLNVDKNIYNFEILKEDLEAVLKFF